MFRILSRYLPPPTGVQPAVLWGVESHLISLFGDTASAVRVTRRYFNFRYRSAEHFVDVFRTWYGPVVKAFAALPAIAAIELEREITALLEGMNRGGVDSLIVPSEFLEAVITRA